MGRPPKEISEDWVRKLARIGCTNEEIAGFFEVSADTVERRFAGALKRGRQAFKISLRRRQVLAAKGGSIPMLIWLGKQFLGQSEPHGRQDGGEGAEEDSITIVRIDRGKRSD